MHQEFKRTKKVSCSSLNIFFSMYFYARSVLREKLFFHSMKQDVVFLIAKLEANFFVVIGMIEMRFYISQN